MVFIISLGHNEKFVLCMCYYEQLQSNEVTQWSMKPVWVQLTLNFLTVMDPECCSLPYSQDFDWLLLYGTL
jgi:hypothetical protein